MLAIDSRSYFSRLSVLIILLSLFFIVGCDKELDESGGFYNEKTGKYQYVFPNKKGVDLNPLGARKPRPSIKQKIHGQVVRIISPNDIWVKIEDRQSYMILAQGLSAKNRDDKKKEFMITLEYVSPLGSVYRGKTFKRQWKRYVLKTLNKELTGKNITAHLKFNKKSMRFRGTVYKKIRSKSGLRLRNINLWMVYEGLSYYMIDQGRAPQDSEYLKAQKIAEENSLGIWKYQ